MAVADLRVMGRATQGVRLIKFDEGDSIAAVAKVEIEEAAESEDEPGDNLSSGQGAEPDQNEGNLIVNNGTTENDSEN
jgi:DNA gyrase subunit A